MATRTWRTLGRSVTRPMALVMGLLVSVVVVQSLGQASVPEKITMEPPYDNSGVNNSCGTNVIITCLPSPVTQADATTGLLSAGAMGVRPLPFVGGGAITSAWVTAVHDLAAPASSIDYEVTIDVGSVVVLDGNARITASAQMPGCCFSQGADYRLYRNIVESTPHSAKLHLTLAGPDGVIPSGSVSVRVFLWVRAGERGAVPTPLAEAQVRVSSITAIVHLSGDPNPTPNPSPTVSEIQLDAHGYKQKGSQKADLTWSGASSSSVDVSRDGVVIATTNNDGVFTDHIEQRGKGTYVYRVCEAGTATCSNEANVEF